MWPFRKRELCAADKIAHEILANWNDVEILEIVNFGSGMTRCTLQFHGVTISIIEHGDAFEEYEVRMHSWLEDMRSSLAGRILRASLSENRARQRAAREREANAVLKSIEAGLI